MLSIFKATILTANAVGPGRHAHTAATDLFEDVIPRRQECVCNFPTVVWNEAALPSKRSRSRFLSGVWGRTLHSDAERSKDHLPQAAENKTSGATVEMSCVTRDILLGNEAKKIIAKHCFRRTRGIGDHLHSNSVARESLPMTYAQCEVI